MASCLFLFNGLGWPSRPQNALARLWQLTRCVVISTLRIVSSPKQHLEALEILRSVLGPTETQPGCLSCRLCQEDGPDHATVLCGHWEDEAALQEHIRSDLYRRILVACELSNCPPEFCFHHVSRTQGMDLIHQLRGAAGNSLPTMSQASAS